MLTTGISILLVKSICPFILLSLVPYLPNISLSALFPSPTCPQSLHTGDSLYHFIQLQNSSFSSSWQPAGHVHCQHSTTSPLQFQTSTSWCFLHLHNTIYILFLPYSISCLTYIMVAKLTCNSTSSAADLAYVPPSLLDTQDINLSSLHHSLPFSLSLW